MFGRYVYHALLNLSMEVSRCFGKTVFLFFMLLAVSTAVVKYLIVSIASVYLCLKYLRSFYRLKLLLIVMTQIHDIHYTLNCVS